MAQSFDYVFSMRLLAKDLAALDRLAKGSGRSRAQLVRYMIRFAAQNPQAAQALGVIENRESLEVKGE